MENLRKYMLERFLKYVTFDTESCDDATTVPTTEGQFVFARYLEQQLKEMGLEDIVLDDKGYLYATLPANCDDEMPTQYHPSCIHHIMDLKFLRNNKNHYHFLIYI